MYTASLQRVGEAVMVAVPQELLDELGLREGSTVALKAGQEELIVSGGTKPRYTLEELLEQCDGEMERSPEDEAWLEMKPVGRELL